MVWASAELSAGDCCDVSFSFVRLGHLLVRTRTSGVRKPVRRGEKKCRKIINENSLSFSPTPWYLFTT